MKKRISIPLIVVGSVVAAILIAVLTLSLITINPFKSFEGYKTVAISTATDSYIGDFTTPARVSSKAKFDKNLKKSSFSVIHAVLEGAFDYSPNFVYELDDKGKAKKDDNDQKIKTELTLAQIKETTKPDEKSYVVEFIYDSLRDYKVDKNSSIAYNRMLVKVATTNGEVHEITFYLYDANMVDAVNPDSQEYRINPLTIRANTSALYIALGEIVTEMAL